MMMGYLCFENWNWIDNFMGIFVGRINLKSIPSVLFNSFSMHSLLRQMASISESIWSHNSSHLPNLSFSTIHQTQNIIFPTLIRQIMSRIQALFSQYVVHWTQSSNSDAFIFAGWTVFIFGIRVQIIIHRLKDSKAKNLCAPLVYKILLQPV